MNNAVRNVGYGIILKICQIILPFCIRTVMIHTLGISYLGLNGLFISILQVLNLAELGVGSAMVYGMYKPLVENDTPTICALLKLYRTYYRIIGLIIGVLGVSLIPFLPSLIHDVLPSDVDLTVLYLMNLSVTVLSYWLLSYRSSLLLANQRVDITNRISIVTTLVQNGLQLLILCFMHNYYAFLAAALVIQVANNLITAVVTLRMYPNYRARGRMNDQSRREINRHIRDLFTSKIGAVIVYDADTIVISTFLGLSVLAKYQNYYYILNAVLAMVSILFSACMAGVGNSIITESKEKNLRDLHVLTLIVSWVSGVCVSTLLCLYQPFMTLWMGEENLLPTSVIVLMCVMYFVQEINQLLNMYKDAAGIWHSDRWRPLITAGTNLAVNILLVHFIGLYGVILSTVLSTLWVGMPWLIHNLFDELFDKRYMLRYVKLLIESMLTVAAAAAICWWLCTLIPLKTGIALLAVRLAVCAIVPNLMFLLAWGWKKEFRICIQMLRTILGKG